LFRTGESSSSLSEDDSDSESEEDRKKKKKIKKQPQQAINRTASAPLSAMTATLAATSNSKASHSMYTPKPPSVANTETQRKPSFKRQNSFFSKSPTPSGKSSPIDEPPKEIPPRRKKTDLLQPVPPPKPRRKVYRKPPVPKANGRIDPPISYSPSPVEITPFSFDTFKILDALKEEDYGSELTSIMDLIEKVETIKTLRKERQMEDLKNIRKPVKGRVLSKMPQHFFKVDEVLVPSISRNPSPFNGGSLPSILTNSAERKR